MVMGPEDEPTDQFRFIGRARPPQPPPSEPEPGWDDPPMPVDDVPMSLRESTSRYDKQRNQRH
jgi:hypothetical protein